MTASVEEWKRRYETARLAHEEGRAEIERLWAMAQRDEKSYQAEIERLRAALQRIDGINDNPACFNPMIDDVLRRALEHKP